MKPIAASGMAQIHEGIPFSTGGSLDAVVNVNE
jgi:hypothetical protein